jgi:type III pantothenate kinase
MTVKVPQIDLTAPIILLDIGNTSIHIGTWHKEQVLGVLVAPRQDTAAFEQAFAEHHQRGPAGAPIAVAISSVVPETLETMRAFVLERTGREALVIGERIPLPVDLAVSDKASVGRDRLCAAAAAYEKLQTGCTIINFGTAVTVDLMDDDGVFQGGAIMPGVRMQLRALHEFTAALPAVEPGFPETPYGRNTTEAIQTGVCRGIAGAVRGMVEGYATQLNRWPQVLATGGDLELLLPHCDFIDTPVKHLVLRGVGVAYSRLIAAAIGQ